MKSQRGLITGATFAAAAALAGSLAVQAQASTLLSGYGGPGQGNQAIIGATLINPPSGGGGGAGGGGGSAAGAETLAAAAAAAAASSHTTATAGAGGPGRTVSGAHRPHGATVRGTPAYTPAAGSRAPEPAVGSSALGLSAVDFVYIVLVLGGLLAAGALTRRLASPAP
jgi:hypothetical protein